MLRTLTLRALLLAALAAPLAAGAQTAGNIAITPSDTYGGTACNDAANQVVTLTWTIAFTTGTVAIPTSGFYRVLASNTADCPDQDTATGKLTGILNPSNIAASTTTQSYPGSGDPTLHLSDFLTAAGKACNTTDTTIFVCVRLFPAGGGTAVGNAQAAIGLQLQPPVAPTLDALDPGDSALTARYSDGTGGTVTAVSYKATARAVNASEDPTTHTATSTTKSVRIAGLKNDVQYSVTVQAVSSGGNVSLASNALLGTPKPVIDFWQAYQNAGGEEQGGCAGGAGGLLSLLGALGLARVLRRRS